MESPEIFESRVKLSDLQTAIDNIRNEIGKIVVGQNQMIDLLITAIFSGGHVLLEGVPGVAKTLTAKLIARTINTGFSRISFTPDLMPSDVIGTLVFNAKTSDFDFKKGPVFSNIILADEINRAPAKTQAALFEVMEEHQVTVDGKTYPMSVPFMIIATQNPIEHEGTYRLPEAQLDRFLFKVKVDYPGKEQEINMLTNYHNRKNTNDISSVSPVLSAKDVVEFQQRIRSIHIEPHLINYISDVIHHTRNNKSLYLGASPRAAIAILTASKAYAAIHGRDFVTPEDIQFVTYPILRHRIMLTAEKEMEGLSADDVIKQIIQGIEVPRYVKFIKKLYFAPLFFTCLAALVMLFIFGFIWPLAYAVAKVTLLAFFVAVIADFTLVFRKGKTLFARRILPEKLSNGDNNEMKIFIENFYRFPLTVKVIDEIPFQFQVRDFSYSATIPVNGHHTINYMLRPVKRGEYSFGGLNVYAAGPLGLVRRRFIFDQQAMVPVYPSFLQMQKYELLAISNNLQETGIKKLRKIGHSSEFENIREYVPGDDPRTINWRATARKSDIMVNHYIDEKSQQVYCVIDKGRTMRIPSEGLSLLDYAINASLVISNIAMRKEDKAGIITFSDKIGTVLKAEKKRSQLHLILETLYNQKTKYLESDFEILYAQVRHNLHQRALLILFSNFGSVSALYRQMPYLRKIAKSHLLVVVFFEDTELDKILDEQTGSTEQVYIKTIAEQFMFAKKQMVKELEAVGIHAILTPPASLTVNVINKYLELKARRLI